MYFRDIIGQEEAKQRLIKEAEEGKIAHARLFFGKRGVGKLPLAIAYARYLCCENPNSHDACGTCPSCAKFNKLAHPDLHFVFPVVKKKNKDTVSDDWLTEWRELLTEQPYFGLDSWLKEMNAENQQAQIYVKESDEIVRKLSFKSSQGKYKIMIIWLPEKMNAECSNKLLKLLEEPPSKTLFLMISEEPDILLSTIQSRVQRFRLPEVKEGIMEEMLIQKYGLTQEEARNVICRSEGSWLKALETIHLNEDEKLFFDLFVSLMRLAYQRRIREMKQWSETVSTLGRERQKLFLNYLQRMIRENFVYNFHEQTLMRLNLEEKEFSKRFAPYINERNVMGIMDELSKAEHHIEQNVNARMVFFDLALKMIVFIVKS